tara:strand:- start:10080 stop:10295 length:216 start_codon:yes stop_codon:yes gene_type:complete
MPDFLRNATIKLPLDNRVNEARDNHPEHKTAQRCFNTHEQQSVDQFQADDRDLERFKAISTSSQNSVKRHF